MAKPALICAELFHAARLAKASAMPGSVAVTDGP
jgi:hypothetical protein